MEYFQNVDVNKVNDNKMFWKTVTPRFSNKCKTANTIILTEGDMIIKNEKLIADTFNNYFADITKTLKLKKHPNFDGQSLSIINLVLLITSKTMKVIKSKKRIILKRTHLHLPYFQKGTFLKR